MKIISIYRFLITTVLFSAIPALTTIAAEPSAETATGSLPLISVEGNRFVDENGNTVTFQGVSVADPHRLENIGQWNRELFREISDWGANVIRLPVHPMWWRERGTDAYLELIDQAVEWAREFDIYLIIDWHSIGNLRTELFTRDIYETSLRETFEFWRIIASRYAGEPVVAFYEIFNEPTTSSDRLGAVSWEQWKEIVTDIIIIIFANNPDAIPLVAGFDWGYDLTPVRHSPLDIEGIAYVTHPYPQKRSQPWLPKWEEDFGFAADTYPVFATELGFMQEEERGAHIPVIGDEEYGRTLMRYFREKGISWVAWVFDPQWSPMLIEDWDYTPTRSGRFFRDVMLGKEKLD
ncbi:MAG: glycoside hydrolase family 5 protein [Marinilabiliales bacterium]|nr:MAG: glycoside hydrolase family 5 protein [Marinilabiliales bacterium]